MRSNNFLSPNHAYPYQFPVLAGHAPLSLLSTPICFKSKINNYDRKPNRRDSFWNGFIPSRESVGKRETRGARKVISDTDNMIRKWGRRRRRRRPARDHSKVFMAIHTVETPVNLPGNTHFSPFFSEIFFLKKWKNNLFVLLIENDCLRMIWI